MKARSLSPFRLGFVEGFYGRPWSDRERTDAAEFLSKSGFKFYLYAPKGETYLRRRWRERWPEDKALKLRELCSHFHRLGLSFGAGLSPHEFHRDGSGQAEHKLLMKVEEIVGLGVDHVALLFDDMKGDLPGLAKTQVALVHAVKKRWPDLALSLCPTYYSLDPLLDRMFGPRPVDYLKTIGKTLAPDVEVFWTGEKICSKSYTPEHLREIADLLARPPLLWDNYPVNDTETMCGFLHLRPFTDRPALLATVLSGHLINPMLEAVLSRIPALTLLQSYAQGRAYRPDEAFAVAASAVLGEALAARVGRDLAAFADEGHLKLGAQRLASLQTEYAAFDHPAAREIVAWLKGDYAVTPEQIRAQQ